MIRGPWIVPQKSTERRTGALRISQITSMYSVDYVVDQAVQIRVFLAQFVYFVAGMQHGSVVLASKDAANLRQRGMRQLLDQIHGDLPRKHYFLGVGFLFQLRRLKLELVGHGAENRIHGDAFLLSRDQMF